jgi:hypothetical protein
VVIVTAFIFVCVALRTGASVENSGGIDSMIKTVAEPKQRAEEALQDAYGRTQATPDGMYCRIGRIDRAYRLMAAKGETPKFRAAIKEMEDEATTAFSRADRAIVYFERTTRREGLTDALNTPVCDCPYCSQEPTWGGKKIHEWA